MKKLLGLIGAFALTVSASSSIVACSRPTSEPTYETVEDAIKALKLISYAKNGTTAVTKVVANIRKDAKIILLTNNYVLGVTFDQDKLILDKIKVINNNTKEALKKDDLVSDTVLSLQVTFTYAGKDIEASSSILNIITKSDQEIVDYINSYNFNKVLKNSALGTGYTVAQFQDKIKKWLLKADIFGSFSTFITTTSFIIESDDIKKGDGDLSQDDLNKPGTLGITVNYKYGTIDNQNISFKINISKTDVSTLKLPRYEELTISLPDKTKTSLSELAVDKIKTRY